MAEYQVIARKYRPKTFREVIGQEHIIRTLKNALKQNRLAHAYLFSGSRGTGKTTLARILAKALNCEKLSQDFEPCCACSSCTEIGVGASIDVLEIDGASHRGIDDIRLISESVGYAPTKGRYKIYIIDEVHMLTKEAFNALLKTLEEPPPKVKFFFATTEAHKVPETIVSRCQRFNLRRIPTSDIVKKLTFLAQELRVDVEKEALFSLAESVDGGLRDAESLFDQMISFSDGKITQDVVHDVLGKVSRKLFLDVDDAFTQQNFQKALKIAQDVFFQGKDIASFFDDFAKHIRAHLLLKIGSTELLEDLDSEYIASLKKASNTYSQDECLAILELIVETSARLKISITPLICLETFLMRTLKLKYCLPIETVVQKLISLEKEITKTPSVSSQPKQPPAPLKEAPRMIATPHPPASPRAEILPSLEKKTEEPKKPEIIEEVAPLDMRKKSHYDTLLQFASVELEGTLHRKQTPDTRRK